MTTVSLRQRRPSSPSIPSTYSVLNSFRLNNLPFCSELSSFRKPPLIACLSRLGWAQLSHRACAQLSWRLGHSAVLVCIWPCLLPWIVRRAVTASYSALGSHCPAWRKVVELHGGVGASRPREEEGQVVTVPGLLGAEVPTGTKWQVALERWLVRIWSSQP